MTGKHFNALAAALKASKPAPHWDRNKMVQWIADVNAIAKACMSVNPSFRRDTFLDACGFDDDAKSA